AAPARRFGRPAAVAIEEPEPEPEPSPVAGYARRAAMAGASTVDISDSVVPPAPRGDFPIADYDTLRAPELLRRVDDLDAAQLEQVRAREASSKNRISIISRIDTRLESMQEPGWGADEVAWEAEAPAADEPAAAGDELPIANYDNLRVGQILPLLRDLSPDE